MRRFRFNLEKLLELRRYDEQKWEINLGRIISKCTSMEHRIRDLGMSKSAAFRKYDLKSSGIEILKVSEVYISRLSSEIESAELLLDSYIAEKIEVQRKFVEVSNKRKILDKLKDKESAAYYRDQAAAESREVDDLNIGMALRKRIKRAQSA